jgi:hypothetical protein
MTDKTPKYFITLDAKLANALQVIAVSAMDIRQIKTVIEQLRLDADPKKKLYRNVHKSIQKSAVKVLSDLAIDPQLKDLDPTGKKTNNALIEAELVYRVLKSVSREDARLNDLDMNELKEAQANLMLVVEALKKSI